MQIRRDAQAVRSGDSFFVDCDDAGRGPLDVQSRHLMERIGDEPFWLDCPALANELVRREAPQRLQSAPEVVGCDEIVEMRTQLLVRFVEITADRRLLQGWVHALDLPVGPWMPWFRQPVIDIQESTGVFEGMGAEQLASTHEFLDLRRAPCLSARIGEMGSMIGEDCVDLVRD